MSHCNLQAQLKTTQADTQPKFLTELANPPKKFELKKIPSLQKNKKRKVLPSITVLLTRN